MFLALKEMARAKTRFGLLVAAIALLVFLILFQQSLQNGLITGFVGAIRNQNAPALVYWFLIAPTKPVIKPFCSDCWDCPMPANPPSSGLCRRPRPR